MELNREQIIKALECCTRGRKSKDDRPCLECPYNECNLVGGTSERQTSGTCQGWLMKDALAVIKELDQKHEMLSESYDHLEKTKDELLSERARLTEENERLLTALANYDRLTDERIAEEYYTAEAYEELREVNERLRTESDRLKAWTVDALTEFSESVKRYYSALPGATVGAAVRFYVDEKLKEALDKI